MGGVIMRLKELSVSYEKTVYEQPFAPQKFGCTLSCILDDDSEIDRCKELLGAQVINSVKELIDRYTEAVLDYNDLNRVQRGESPRKDSFTTSIDIN